MAVMATAFESAESHATTIMLFANFMNIPTLYFIKQLEWIACYQVINIPILYFIKHLVWIACYQVILNLSPLCNHE